MDGTVYCLEMAMLSTLLTSGNALVKYGEKLSPNVESGFIVFQKSEDLPSKMLALGQARKRDIN